MNKRLKQYIEYLQVSTRYFEQKISTSNGVIARFLSKNTSIQSDLLSKIHDNFPELNLDWLITGRGSMLYNEPKPQPLPVPVSSSPDTETLQAIADERERTIQVLQETNANLLAEIQQLRAYVNTTSTKYIQIVEQTLEAARQTNATVQQFQTQIGFHHTEQHLHTIAAHHKDKTH